MIVARSSGLPVVVRTMVRDSCRARGGFALRKNAGGASRRGETARTGSARRQTWPSRGQRRRLTPRVGFLRRHQKRRVALRARHLLGTPLSHRGLP